MGQKSLVALSVLISISPFVLLAVFYDRIPAQIPAFVDMKGNAKWILDKSLFSAFRLPLMGGMIQIICLTMWALELEDQRKRNQFLWLSVSLLAALKMSFTSLEILFYNHADTLLGLKSICLVLHLPCDYQHRLSCDSNF